MKIVFLSLMFILGACAGSFLCCQVRRLRLKEKKKEELGSRSVCLKCKTRLKWYDNIPIVSWLILGGKCRKCKKKIGGLEFFSELIGALSFLVLSIGFNLETAGVLEWAIFVITLLLTLTLGFLAIYDGGYGELPTVGLIMAIVIALILLGLKITGRFLEGGFSPELIYNPLLSVLILGGIYLLLYLVSKGKWVGDGDYLLGIAIGLALFDPFLALLVLFFSNFLACFVMLPFVQGKKNKKIPFGPFLVIAYVFVTAFAEFFLSFVV